MVLNDNVLGTSVEDWAVGKSNRALIVSFEGYGSLGLRIGRAGRECVKGHCTYVLLLSFDASFDFCGSSASLRYLNLSILFCNLKESQLRQQQSSFDARVSVIYSASVDDKATVACLLEHQLTGPPLSIKMKPEVDFLVEWFPAQSESE